MNMNSATIIAYEDNRHIYISGYYYYNYYYYYYYYYYYHYY